MPENPPLPLAIIPPPPPPPPPPPVALAFLPPLPATAPGLDPEPHPADPMSATNPMTRTATGTALVRFMASRRAVSREAGNGARAVLGMAELGHGQPVEVENADQQVVV